MKLKPMITNMFGHKKMKKLTIIFLFMLLVILLPNTLHSMPKSTFIKTSLIDNPLESNQPTNTPPTSTGSHPIKNSPASTNISEKP
uniref:Female-specific orf protein n=1 Tax=Toxolasma pullus TaxID=2202388 RepID=A0A4Y1LTP6_9BIVA|nr:female-specific orf protein [Toxolasma pullus]